MNTSVIIPTLNEEQALGVLLAQLKRNRDRPPLEVIVSDGGSTDGTLALARAAGARVVTVSPGEHQTIAAGRNAGARAASGDLLLFFNADVELPAETRAFLETLIRAVEEDGASTCRVLVHDREARWVDRIVLGTCNVLFWSINRIGMGMGRGECHAVRRDVFEAVGGYREDLVAGEDFDLFNRIAAWGRKTGRARIRFLWAWTVYESPRRYRRLGYPRTMASWFANFFSVTFRGRSASKSWIPIR